MEHAGQVTGVFVRLNCSPLRIVFRRRIDYRHDVYEVYKPWGKIEAVCEVIRVLSRDSDDFVQRILSIDETYCRGSSYRTRRYFHTDRAQLYPGRDDLVKYSHKVGALWIGTNLSTSGMLQAIREACEAIKAEFGSLEAIKL